MKFRFLGGLDCPGWLLKKICDDFGDFTVLRFRTLCQVAAEWCLNSNINEELLIKFKDKHNAICAIKLIGEWILLRPAGNECDVGDLKKEMVQLGLPREHSMMLGKIYMENYEKLKNKARKMIFREPPALLVNQKVDGISIKVGDQLTNISMTENQKLELKSELKEMLSELRNLSKMC